MAKWMESPVCATLSARFHQPTLTLRVVVFLHGGPGGGTSKASATFFDPAIYRVILFDQRGSGRSLPLGEIRENTSVHLVADIEVLRKHLGITRWHVFGGSWGSTLALLYAQAHPEAVISLALRGIFLESKEELDFNTKYEGSWRLQPELYDEFIGLLTEEEQKDVFGGYYKRLKSGDRATALAAGKMYGKWALNMSFIRPTKEQNDELENENEDKTIAHALIECHYHASQAWLEDLQILKPENIERIKHIPTSIVNGRYDLLCPPIMAWKLHKALPGSKTWIIQDAGHASTVSTSKVTYILLDVY